MEAESIQLEPQEIILNETQKGYGLEVVFSPNNVSDVNLSHLEWTSSNRDIIRVYGNGDVNAVSPGTANITAKTANGKTATCKVTVEKTYPYRMVDGIQYYITSEGMATVQGLGPMSDAELSSYGAVDLRIPSSITVDGKTYKVTQIKGRAFEGFNLTNVTLEEGLEYIGVDNLTGTYTSVVIPKSIKYLGPCAFRSSKLSNVIMMGDAPQVASWGMNDGTFEPYDGVEIVISVPAGAKEYDEFPWTNYTIVYRGPEIKVSATQNVKAVSAGKQRVKLTWDAVEGAEGYLVYGQKNGKYGYVGMTTLGTTYTDTKALDNDYNFYWVFPYHKDVEGKMIVGGTPKYVYGKAR